MKTFKVHSFREVRCTFLVQAESHEAALLITQLHGATEADEMEDACAPTIYAVVDSLFPDGEIDYAAVKEFDGSQIQELDKCA